MNQSTYSQSLEDLQQAALALLKLGDEHRSGRLTPMQRARVKSAMADLAKYLTQTARVLDGGL